MKTKQFFLVSLVSFACLATAAFAISLGGVKVNVPGTSGTNQTQTATTGQTQPGQTRINNSDAGSAFQVDMRKYLQSKFSYNQFYELYESNLGAVSQAIQAKLGAAPKNVKDDPSWLTKTGTAKNGKDSCVQTSIGQRTKSSVTGVGLFFTSGWCDFLSERNGLSIGNMP